jgi:hypothetical protein
LKSHRPKYQRTFYDPVNDGFNRINTPRPKLLEIENDIECRRRIQRMGLAGCAHWFDRRKSASPFKEVTGHTGYSVVFRESLVHVQRFAQVNFRGIHWHGEGDGLDGLIELNRQTLAWRKSAADCHGKDPGTTQRCGQIFGHYH